MVDMLNVESIVFTRIKGKLPQNLKTKYNDLSFTTSNKVQATAKFPNVYVHLLPAVEKGRDLEGLTINGGLFTFQIEVTDSQSQNIADEVMQGVVTIMKSMRFEVMAFPEFRNADSAYRSVARFRRVIGNGDTL